MKPDTGNLTPGKVYNFDGVVVMRRPGELVRIIEGEGVVYYVEELDTHRGPNIPEGEFRETKAVPVRTTTLAGLSTSRQEDAELIREFNILQ